MKVRLHILLFLLLVTPAIYSQNKEIDDLTGRELKMTFPSVYFKNNSTEYAEMPNKADSILHFIASHKKEIKSYVIWRDSTENEELTSKRITKLKQSLAKYKADKINIKSMGNAQKISRYTINKAEGFEQNQYLLSLNSVFEVTRTKVPKNQVSFEKTKERKHLPRLVWCGWKYGFHWDTLGNTKKVSADKANFSKEEKKIKNDHIHHPRFWCMNCWRNHRFTKEYRQLHVK